MIHNLVFVGISELTEEERENGEGIRFNFVCSNPNCFIQASFCVSDPVESRALNLGITQANKFLRAYGCGTY